VHHVSPVGGGIAVRAFATTAKKTADKADPSAAAPSPSLSSSYSSWDGRHWRWWWRLRVLLRPGFHGSLPERADACLRESVAPVPRQSPRTSNASALNSALRCWLAQGPA